MPRIPHRGDAHDGSILQMNLERTLCRAFLFPFKEPAQWNDASLPDDQALVQPAFKDSFALRIDCRNLRLEFLFPPRYQLPPHGIELTRAINQTQDGRIVRRAHVVVRFERIQFQWTLIEVLKIKFV